MSDEESFVILGTSPTGSLEADGNNVPSVTKSSSSDSSAALEGSSVSLLWSKPQIEQNKSPNVSLEPKSSSSDLSATIKGSSVNLLWSKPQIEQNKIPNVSLEPKSDVADKKDDLCELSFEDCAIPSPLTQSPKTSLTPKTINNIENNKENLEPFQEVPDNMTKSQLSNGSNYGSKHNSLAASFIMGDINADVLKSSVFSQFPSISMQASAEDVVKLQNMVTEFVQLKTTLEKVNCTMKLFYENSLQWKDKMNHMSTYYKQQLDECQKQISELRAENTSLKKAIEDQVEQTKAVDVARQSDRNEMIKSISEKTALVENMRAQIVKLEQEHISSFEVLKKSPMDNMENGFDKLYVTRSEHNIEVKNLKRELSELLASNLDFKDIEKQYIDELNCLKHNLKSSGEIINRAQSEIASLQSLNVEHQRKITELEVSNRDLLVTSAQQNERILNLEKNNQSLLNANAELNERTLLLEQQNQVHKKDFEMEREGRQNAVGEKQKILQDLRALQMRNQELIEERQKCVEEYEKRVSSASMASGIGNTTPLIAAAAAAQISLNNPQRPIRNLPSTQSADTSNQYNCPVCNKGFKSISVLTSHVNDCIDKN